MNLVMLEDGPAEHTTLELERAPDYLRVVKGIDGKWDALDLLTDEPALGDVIYVYRRAPGPMGFVCMRGGKGSYRTIGYRHLPDFPTEGLGDVEHWQQTVYAYAFAHKEKA